MTCEHWPAVQLELTAVWQDGGGGGQVLPGEVCGGVPSCSGGRWSAACQPSEPQSLPGGATWREPGDGPEAAGCQVQLGLTKATKYTHSKIECLML